jgi:hypothetical protein
VATPVEVLTRKSDATHTANTTNTLGHAHSVMTHAHTSTQTDGANQPDESGAEAGVKAAPAGKIPRNLLTVITPL